MVAGNAMCLKRLLANGAPQCCLACKGPWPLEHPSAVLHGRDMTIGVAAQGCFVITKLYDIYRQEYPPGPRPLPQTFSAIQG